MRRLIRRLLVGIHSFFWPAHSAPGISQVLNWFSKSIKYDNVTKWAKFIFIELKPQDRPSIKYVRARGVGEIFLKHVDNYHVSTRRAPPT